MSGSEYDHVFDFLEKGPWDLFSTAGKQYFIEEMAALLGGTFEQLRSAPDEVRNCVLPEYVCHTTEVFGTRPIWRITLPGTTIYLSDPNDGDEKHFFQMDVYELGRVKSSCPVMTSSLFRHQFRCYCVS